MLNTNTLTVFIIILAISIGLYFFVQRSNQEIAHIDDSAITKKIMQAIKQLNLRLETLERKYSLDKEQTERSRKNIYNTLGMQMEARKLDNIAVTGLLARSPGNSTITNNIA